MRKSTKVFLKYKHQDYEERITLYELRVRSATYVRAVLLRYGPYYDGLIELDSGRFVCSMTVQESIDCQKWQLAGHIALYPTDMRCKIFENWYGAKLIE